MKRVLVAALVILTPLCSQGEEPKKTPVTWSRSIDLSAGGEGGNKENYNVSLASAVSFEAAKWSGEFLDLTISHTAIRRPSGAGDRTEKDRRFEYDGAIKRKLGRFKATLDGSWDDLLESRSLDRVWKVALGMGATLHKGKKLTLELDSVGASYRKENTTAGSQNGDIWAQVQHTLTFQFNERVTFKWDSDLQLNPDDDASGKGRLVSDQECELDSGLGKHVSLVVKLDWELDSAPVARESSNIKGWDLSLSVGLRVASK